MKEQYNYINNCSESQVHLKKLTDELVTDIDSGEVFELLCDKSSTGRIRPWKEKKEYNMKLSDIYQYVNPDKSERLKTCGNVLDFTMQPDGHWKLTGANFCRVRLCPMCQWRRSLKVYSQLTKVLSQFVDRYAIVCLNLTVKNCSKYQLSETLDHMTEAFNLFTKYKAFKDVILGYYRATEITHNLDTDEFHPHYHTLLLVDKYYSKHDGYIKQKQWRELWGKALKADYDPIVYVHMLYLKPGQDITGALCEATKYTIKESDYITDNIKADVELLSILDKALNKRRFISLGGIVKDMHKKLNLSEIEDDSDLIHIDEDKPELTEELKDMIRFCWHSGIKDYYNKGE